MFEHPWTPELYRLDVSSLFTQPKVAFLGDHHSKQTPKVKCRRVSHRSCVVSHGLDVDVNRSVGIQVGAADTPAQRHLEGGRTKAVDHNTVNHQAAEGLPICTC
jgi:hypothetical protein